MRIFRCEFSPARILTTFLLLGVAGWIVPAAADLQDRGTGTVSGKSPQPVTVTSDELISDDTTKTAVFIGNVKVIRGDYTLTADRLEVHYTRRERDAGPRAGARANIQEMRAEGRVRLFSSQLTATAERAFYDARDRRIDLFGDDATVTSDNGTVRGSQITLFLDTERFQVTGGHENRVRAVFKKSPRK